MEVCEKYLVMAVRKVILKATNKSVIKFPKLTNFYRNSKKTKPSLCLYFQKIVKPSATKKMINQKILNFKISLFLKFMKNRLKKNQTSTCIIIRPKTNIKHIWYK